MVSTCSVVLLRTTLLGVADDVRSYSGPLAIDAPQEVAVADAEQRDTPPSDRAPPPARNASSPIVRIDDADRWRFAFSLHSLGVIAIGNQIGLVGLGVGAYLGVGYPRLSRDRYARHSFGVASELTYTFPRATMHRHRLAVSGLLWHDTSFTRRYLSLYYFAGAGAAVHGRSPGGSIGGRVGLASSRDLHYIIALGIDLDVVRRYDSGDPMGMALLFSLSLLSFGML